MDKVLTRDEIIYKNIESKPRNTGRNIYDEKGYTVNADVEKSMDEYSKQMAIGFAEWIWENGWVRCYYDGGYHGYYDSNILTEGSTTEITVDELYSLFEKHLQTIQ